jgi:hypothetical protein
MTEDVVGKAMRLRLNPINASQNLVQAFQALRRHTLYGVLLAYLSVELTFHIHWEVSRWKAMLVEGLLLFGVGWCAFGVSKVARVLALWKNLPFSEVLTVYVEIIASTWRRRPQTFEISSDNVLQVGKQHLKFLQRLLWAETVICSISCIAYPIDGLTQVKLGVIGQMLLIVQVIVLLLGLSRLREVSIRVGLSNVTIQEVSPAAPAAKAGLQAGDVIEAINGQVLTGLTPEEAIRLSYQSSSPLELQVRRKAMSAPLELHIGEDGGLNGVNIHLVYTPRGSATARGGKQLQQRA